VLRGIASRFSFAWTWSSADKANAGTSQVRGDALRN